jgi:hypothetical protein
MQASVITTNTIMIQILIRPAKYKNKLITDVRNAADVNVSSKSYLSLNVKNSMKNIDTRNKVPSTPPVISLA